MPQIDRPSHCGAGFSLFLCEQAAAKGVGLRPAGNEVHCLRR